MNEEEKREYDAMRGAAHLYHTSGVFLQDLSPIIMQMTKGQLPVDLNANLLTAVTIYALSSEVALKALIKSEGHTIPHRHDLKSLFEDLSTELQTAIKAPLTDKGYDVDKDLDDNKDAFIQWRYFYEGSSMSAGLSFLRDLSEELTLQCNKAVSTHQ